MLRWFIPCLLLLAPLLPAQSSNPKDAAAGKILVAARELGDPNFAQTVVLLVQFDDKGVVGLVVNRRTRVPVSRVLEQVPAARNRTDPVYLGGPVERASVFALLGTGKPPQGAQQVLGGVYLLGTKDSLQKGLASDAKPDQLHVYLGYAGWTPAQLRNEIGVGAWFIFPGDAHNVFDAEPASLWSRMIQLTELHIARLLP